MGYLKIITAILIWSSLGIFVRKLEGIDLPITAIIFYPAVIAGALQLLLLSVTGQFRNARRADSSANSVFLLLLTPIFFLANTFLFFFAFTHTTITNAVFAHYTAPIFVALMAPVFLKERVHIVTWLAIVLSSLGLWLMLGGISIGSSEWNGITAGVFSGLTYAFLIMIIRSIASKYPVLFIVFVQNAILCLMLLPFVLKMPLTLQSLPYLIAMGIVHSTIAPLLYVQGFRSVKANEAAILGYFEPVGATILALIFLHEIPHAKALLGGALILFSGFIILIRRRE